jgi:hypothetical protein
MNEKMLRARIQHKHKTEAEWYLDVYTAVGSTELRENPFVPLGGELIIFDKDATHEFDRFKFGDGETNVMELPFASTSMIISGNKVDGSEIESSVNGSKTILGDSGVTAGEYGPTSNQNPNYGATFNVPDIKVNSKGIITSIENRTVKIPASDNSETTLTITDKVQTDTTDLVYAVTNLIEGGTKGHEITPTYTGLPTKAYVDRMVTDST